MVDPVRCVFWSAERGLQEHWINIATGHGSAMVGLKLAASNSALALGYALFAIPDRYSTDHDTWLVFRHENDVSEVMARLPTKPAAEMWMIHHGHKF